MFQDLQSFPPPLPPPQSEEFSTMKTSIHITSDPCNLVKRCTSGVCVLTEAGLKKRGEKRLSWGQAGGPSSHLSVLRVESVPEI